MKSSFDFVEMVLNGTAPIEMVGTQSYFRYDEIQLLKTPEGYRLSLRYKGTEMFSENFAVYNICTGDTLTVTSVIGLHPVEIA
jgi:hypothetical protein